MFHSSLRLPVPTFPSHPPDPLPTRSIRSESISVTAGMVGQVNASQ